MDAILSPPSHLTIIFMGFFSERPQRENNKNADGLRKGLTSYGDAGFSLFLRKAFIKAMGYRRCVEPSIVGITNTHSDYNPAMATCLEINRGGEARRDARPARLPMVFPTISIAESFAHPDLDVSAQPDGDGHRGDDPGAADGFGGGDRRLRQDTAGADHGRGQRRSADRRDPRRTDGGGAHKGEVLGPAPIAVRLWAKYRAGEIETSRARPSTALAPSVGTCMVMGTASTMACITEALACRCDERAIPAPHAERFRSAELAARSLPHGGCQGTEAERIADARGLSKTPRWCCKAIGGSDQRPHSFDRGSPIVTSHRVDLAAFDRLGREVPVLIDLNRRANTTWSISIMPAACRS